VLRGAALPSLYGSIGGALLTVSLALFAFTTILGWNYYGERAVVPTAWVGGGAVAADTIVEPYSTIGTTIRAPRA